MAWPGHYLTKKEIGSFALLFSKYEIEMSDKEMKAHEPDMLVSCGRVAY